MPILNTMVYKGLLENYNPKYKDCERKKDLAQHNLATATAETMKWLLAHRGQTYIRGTTP
jgi:hypothetical protein